jgi:hypothetical protein
MSSPNRIVYTPRQDTSPELEVAALAAAYRYILRCHEERQAAHTDGGEASEDNELGGAD